MKGLSTDTHMVVDTVIERYERAIAAYIAERSDGNLTELIDSDLKFQELKSQLILHQELVGQVEQLRKKEDELDEFISSKLIKTLVEAESFKCKSIKAEALDVDLILRMAEILAPASGCPEGWDGKGSLNRQRVKGHTLTISPHIQLRI